MTDKQSPKRFARRAIGIGLCFSPAVLLITSIIVALHGHVRAPFDAVSFIVAALLLALLNFYLSFIRPWVLLRRHGSLDGIPHVSGFPILGTLLVFLGGAYGFAALGTSLLGIVALVLDTGGLPWFLVATWRDSSLWDTTDGPGNF